MLRKLSVVAAAVTMLGLSALPAAAATTSKPKVHNFTMPAAVGVRGWGSYYTSRGSVHIIVCVKETSPTVDFAQAIGVALSDSASRYQGVDARIFGSGKQACRSMTTKDTAHLIVQVMSGTTDGHAHIGKLKRVY